MVTRQCLKIFDLPPLCDRDCLNAIVRLGFYLEPLTNKLIYEYTKSRKGIVLAVPMTKKHIRKLLGYTYEKTGLIIQKLTTLNVLARDEYMCFFMNPQIIRVENDGSDVSTLRLFKIEDTARNTFFGRERNVRAWVREKNSAAEDEHLAAPPINQETD